MLNNSNATISTTQLTSLNILDPVGLPAQTNGLIFLGNMTEAQKNAYQSDFLKLGALIYNLTKSQVEVYTIANGVATWAALGGAGVIVNAPNLKVTPNGGAAIDLPNNMAQMPIIEGDDALYATLTAADSVITLPTATDNNALLGRTFFYKNNQTPKNSTFCLITTKAPNGNPGDLNAIRIVPIAII